MGTKRKPVSVKAQFIFSVIALIIIICSSFTLAMCMTANNILNENMAGGLSNRAADVSRLVEQQLASAVTQVEDIASREDIRSMDWALQQKALSQEAKRIGISEFLVSYVHAGEGHASGDTMSTSGQRSNLSGEEFYRQAAGGSAYISDAMPGPSGQGMVFCVSAPIYHGSSVVGVLTAAADASLLSDLVNSITLENDGYCYILNQDGVRMASPDPEDVKSGRSDLQSGSSEELAAVQEEMVAGQEGYAKYTADGDGFCISYRPILDGRWSFAVVERDTGLRHGMFRFVRQILHVSIPAIILGAIVSYLIGTSIGNPIARLTRVTRQLAEGNLEVEVDTRASNEARTLAENIIQLVDRLKTYILYIDEVSSVLDEIGRGNLVFELKQEYLGEFDRLKVAMTEIQRSLSHTVFRIVDSADQVNNGSAQIATGSQALAQGTTEQANTVEELTGTVQQLSQNSRDDAAKAMDLSGNMRQIGEEVKSSNLQMQEMVKAMNNISNQSAEIGKIIKAIDEIAFQTNILSLNAAVEAARAGSAGKGFAVVADEVRNLASRSAEAAKNVAELITRSVDTVQEGAGIAAATASSLQKVTADVAGAVDAVEAFNVRYQEQVVTLGRVEDGIHQISAVVQSNSATAEEAAASSEELSSQAEMMKALTDQFHIDERFHQA